MTDERFDISRRKALAALGTIGVASAGAGLGTSAYFSDQETFENNQLVAGTLDMGVGYTAHYSDWSNDENGGDTETTDDDVEVNMYNGPANTTGSASELTSGYTGLPTNDAWLIEVDDPEQFLVNTQTGVYPNAGDTDGDGVDDQGPVECVENAEGALEANVQADDAPKPVIELNDVKPGDFGEVTFDFVLCDNPGYVWLNGSVRSASENGITEPEADDPDEEEGVVELLDVVRAAVWVDDGDNYQDADPDEPLEDVTIGSLREVLGMIDGSNGTALTGNMNAEAGGGTGEQGCFSADTMHSVAFAWWVPVDHGNEIQSDRVEFDLGFYTEQCRHNDGSGLNNEAVDGDQTDDQSGESDDGTADLDVYPGGAGDELVAEFTVGGDDDGDSLNNITLGHNGGTDISNTGAGDVTVEVNGTDVSGDIGDVSGANNGTQLDITLGGNNGLSAGDTVTVTYGNVQSRGDTSSVSGDINGDVTVSDDNPLMMD
jgi:predicted ribosomally synthesized peptide with SipW-like signal peptide